MIATIGMLAVARLSASAGVVPTTASASGFIAANSAASAGNSALLCLGARTTECQIAAPLVAELPHVLDEEVRCLVVHCGGRQKQPDREGALLPLAQGPQTPMRAGRRSRRTPSGDASCSRLADERT